MNIDPYASCPCGSGKQFKWCCKDIYADIDRAFQQEEENQHEAALRIMDEAIAKHPGNPEVYGRKAQLLFMHEKFDEGEAVLQKAFDINPAYPRGLLIRAELRLGEGEITGALILARRAAEAYDPRAVEYLAQVYELIANCEMNLNRPVAAHAALRILLRCQPGDDQLRQQVQAAIGPESRLPACARRPYELRSPEANLDPARRSAWDQVLKEIASPRLGALAAAFERLTQQDPGDAAAWYNLGTVRAWLGDNRKAVDALDRHVEVETDEAKASEAAALGEVLRCGQGLEDVADHVSYQAEYRLRDLEALSKLLQQL